MATEVSSLLEEGIRRIGRASDDPRRDAEVLLSAALEKPRSFVLSHGDDVIRDCEATDRYEAYVTRRAHGEPVAYILGHREFWSLDLQVSPGVLIPRPETELVVERALAHLPGNEPWKVLDLAAGSGAIALAIARERPASTVIGTDASDVAVATARANAARLGLGNAEFRIGNWYEPVAATTFDLVASNPPYIADADPRVEPFVRRYEPHDALFSGPTGLEALENVVQGAQARLRTGGWLVVEHGDTQGEPVRAMLRAAGFQSIATHRDLAGMDRVTEGRT
jgi:release factor glutamine methyltransferase